MKKRKSLVKRWLVALAAGALACLGGCEYYNLSIPDYLEYWTATVAYSGDNLSELDAWSDGKYRYVNPARHGDSLRILVSNPKGTPFEAAVTVTGESGSSKTLTLPYPNGGDAISIPFSQFASVDTGVEKGLPASDAYRVQVAWKRTDSGVEQGETEVPLMFRDQPDNGLIISGRISHPFPAVTQGGSGSIPGKTVTLKNVSPSPDVEIEITGITPTGDTGHFTDTASSLQGKTLRQNDEATFTVTPKSNLYAAAPGTYTFGVEVAYSVKTGSGPSTPASTPLTFTATITVDADPTIRYVGGSNASDTTGDGTEAKPYATVQKAVDDFTSLPANSSAVIYLKGDVEEDNSKPSYDSSTNHAFVNVNPTSLLYLRITSASGSWKIDANRSDSATGRVMYIENAHVTLENVTLTGGHFVQGNDATSGGGVYMKNGSLTVGLDATISGNTAAEKGGGVCVWTGSLTVGADAKIEGNTAGSGGGVHLEADGGAVSFTLSGGTISNNTATVEGGGVYVRYSGASVKMSGGEISDNTSSGVANTFDGGGGVCMWRGTFEMSGGTISGNKSLGTEYDPNDKYDGGGGVLLWDNTTFKMTGGTIIGNTAASKGDGVCVWGGTFTMSGSASVDSGNDVFLNSDQGHKITVTGGLTAQTPVATITPQSYTAGTQVVAADSGVTLADEVGKFAVTPDGSTTWDINTDGRLYTGDFISTTAADFGTYLSNVTTGTHTVEVTGQVDDSNWYDDISFPLFKLVEDGYTSVVIHLDLSSVTGFTELQQEAFYNDTQGQGCENLASIILPKLTTIGTYAFSGCTSLAQVTFGGTQAEWNTAVGSNDPDLPSGCTVTCSDGTINIP